MDKDLQKEVNELYEILNPMNVELEKWLLRNKNRFIESNGNPLN